MSSLTFIRSGHGYENHSQYGRCTAFDGYEIIGNPLGGYDAQARESRVFNRQPNGNGGTCYGAYSIQIGRDKGAGERGSLYILMSHGAGREVWRIPDFYDGGDLKAHILAMPERLQYALLMTLYKMGSESRRQAEQETRRELYEAFVDGRIKKRKQRGSNTYRVSVEDKAPAPRPDVEVTHSEAFKAAVATL